MYISNKYPGGALGDGVVWALDLLAPGIEMYIPTDMSCASPLRKLQWPQAVFVLNDLHRC